MSSIEIHQFPCLNDNYGFLLHDPATGETTAIDTPDANEILKQADLKGWKITQIWNTHWHPDHAGGNKAIKEATGCTIYAPENETEKINAFDVPVREGMTVQLGNAIARVIDVPGHTAGHVAYILDDEKVALVGDTLFALGCGRLFEGSPAQMWDSLSKLKDLPDDFTVYCAHEYTAANADFALTIEPYNRDLREYVEGVQEKRSRKEPTVPTTIGAEKAANPFLRGDVPELQEAMGHAGNAVETFAEIRRRKDNF